MLAESKTIRDIGRALPALVSGPDLGVPVSADLLDAHATALREQYDSLFAVLDRAGNALVEAIETRNPEEIADPDGGGRVAFARRLRRPRPPGQPLHVDRRHDAGGALVRPDLRRRQGPGRRPRRPRLRLRVGVARVAR